MEDLQTEFPDALQRKTYKEISVNPENSMV